MPSPMEFTNLAPDLWIATRPFTNELGVVTSRMTVMGLADGRILVHSPVPIEPDLRSAVENLGPLAAFIAPNLFHHQFVSEWRSAFPDAKAFCAPGLETKRSDIKSDAVLDDVSVPEWKGEVDQLVIKGFPQYSEVVFFHRSSRTLVVSDVAFNPHLLRQRPTRRQGLRPHARIMSAVSDRDLRDSMKASFDGHSNASSCPARSSNPCRRFKRFAFRQRTSQRITASPRSGDCRSRAGEHLVPSAAAPRPRPIPGAELPA